MFRTSIFFCLWHLIDGMTRVSVMVGESVTLPTDVSIIHGNIQTIDWRFGPESTIIAELFAEITYDNQIFGDRLQMDNQTGSLTIRDIRTTDSGLYQLDIVYNPYKLITVLFIVTAYDEMKSVSVNAGESVTLHTDVPIIRRNIHHIEWRFGPESTIIADWFNNITFHKQIFGDRLKMDSQTGSLTIRDIRTTDSGLYQLDIVYNPFKLITVLFNVTAYDCIHCCGFTEAVIRLVISAVVGVATVAIVVYDIRSRRAEKKQRTSQSVSE